MFDRFRFPGTPLSLPAMALLVATLAPSGHAAVQNRITAAITSESQAPLEGNVLPKARLAADLGAADANLQMTDLTLHFSMTDSQQAALTELLLEQQQASSANYQKWLTPEQFADRFGLSTGDIAKVTGWLTSQGLTVTGTARGRDFVTFSGTAAEVEHAFGTTIHSLSLNGEKHFGNLTDPALPAALAGVVSGVTGLHDFRLVSRAKIQKVPAPAADTLHAQFTSSISGNHFVAPADFYTIYDENLLLTNNINGSGIKIAVMGQTDISLSDVAAFRAASGLSVNPPTVMLYGTDPGTSTADLGEAQLDVEWSGAAAPSASIIYVNSKDVIGTSMFQAIDNNLAPIITVSYGNCEANWGASNLRILNTEFQKANAQGITIMGPTGDSGAADCDYQVKVATGGLAVDFPASSPYVTAVGGTMFNEGTGTYWASTNASAYNGSGSAVSYIPEAVWNETTSTAVVGGGGGVSVFFTKPSWQTGTGVPNDFSRDVPDISLNGAASHDGYLICSSGSCTNGYRDSSNNLNVVGGTSVSTPNFAGLIALVEQKIGARLGNANPKIYALANSTYYSSVFHDVTTGTNAVPCTTGSTGCPNGGTIGYAAGVGYDAATGWGSVDAYNLVNDWSLVTVSGTTTGATLSATTVGASAANVTQGTSVTITATVASAATGTTTTPTGTAQLLVDGVASGSGVALVSGTATFTLATTSLTAGVHVIGVAYSGDTTYAGSKGTVSVDITSATTADFSITPAPSTLTIKAGSTGTVTYSLKSLNNYAGSVTMSATAATSITASGGFSVSPVVLTAGSTGTTVFTVNAFVTNATSSTNAFKVAANKRQMPPWMMAGSGVAFASMLLIVVPGRRRRKLSRTAGIFCVLLLAVGAIGMSGCGGSSGSTTSASTTTLTTPGTYTLTITATQGTISHTSALTLVIQ